MQGNTIEIPIVTTQKTNANIERTKNSLKDSRLQHPKKVCLSYININSVRNKLEALSEFVSTEDDFLAISEIKLDSSFPTAQFNLPDFRTPYRKYITGGSGGGLLVYTNGDIPSRMISIRDCPSEIQISPVEMNLKKQKWLVVAIDTPPSQCKSYFITELMKVLDKCRSNFGNTVVLGDFNMEPTNQEMTAFMSDNNFINIIKWNTCCKTSTGT